MPPLAFASSTCCGEHLLGVPLDRLVDGEHEVVSALGRADTGRSPGDARCLAGRARPALTGLAARAAPRTATRCPPSPSLSSADEAEQRRRERARRVEPLRLGEIAESREGRALHTSATVASSTLRATYANALSSFEKRSTSVAWSTPTIGASFAAYASGSLDHARVGGDRGLRHRHREIDAVAIEDAAALCRKRDGADSLAVHRARRGAGCRAPGGRRGARRCAAKATTRSRRATPRGAAGSGAMRPRPACA